MERRSIWQALSSPANFAPLAGKLTVDTAIVGGGITGLTAATLLAKAGQRVALIEAREIGGGTTGESTGNLYPTVGVSLDRLADKWGEEIMREVAASRAFAIDLVERLVSDYGIDCAFARRDWHLFALPDQDGEREHLNREHQAALAAGLPARLVEPAPLPFETLGALVIRRAAQFQPVAYVRGLARAIAGERCKIFEHSPVLNIEPELRLLETASGEVRADRIFLATHVPKGFNLVQTELAPYREYAMAARLASGDYPWGIFWSAEENRHSIRSHAEGGSSYLIVVGQGHKTGQEPYTESCYDRVEAYLSGHFAVEAITHRWSAQGYYAADDLPYIGASAASDHVYIATGYAADGLTYGSLAGFLIAEEILGRPHRHAELYTATRVTPVKSAKKVIQENANVLGEYIKDYARPETRGLRDIAPGEGRIVEIDGERVAAFRDEAGELSVLSPVCTHLKCLVHWNGAERTWDCPCHGSRFATDGEVLEGPALSALKPIAVRESSS